MKAVEEKDKKIVAEQRFKKLAKSWKSETELVSKVNKRVMHPAYQKIIGMDMAAMTEAWLQWGRKAGYLKDCR